MTGWHNFPQERWTDALLSGLPALFPYFLDVVVVVGWHHMSII
jgi:hypothetical protein